MNSNSYLSLSHHPAVLGAADAASHAFGAGPGAVRFIDGTFAPHVELEAASRASSPGRRRASSTPPTRRCSALAITLSGPDTFWIGDALNHNCIIRAMRIANVPSAQRAIFRHNDVADLDHHLSQVPDGTGRVLVIFDGIFSMRGDHAPLDGDRRGRRAARGALPRRHRHDHGRLARHRRLRRDRARHRGALRRARSTSSSGRSARRSA